MARDVGRSGPASDMHIDRIGHLSYCTNVHPGQSLEDVQRALARHVPGIRERVCPDAPFGLGLRLSAQAASELGEPHRMAAFKAWLDTGPYYVYTLNGFPYGAFHRSAVKEAVYRPDWSDARRLSYSNQLARLLAALLPEGEEGSVSTVPGTFKPWANAARLDAITEHLIEHAAELVTLERTRGSTIVLGLEPEPACLLETTGETLAFFQERLHSRAAAQRLAQKTGLAVGAAEAALRRHLGVCYDVCHQAVQFEDPEASLHALRNAGIRIAKLQLSSALAVPRMTPRIAAQLKGFDEPVYLHQTVTRSAAGLTRYPDLPEALSAMAGAEGDAWRVHFHVPVFERSLPPFETTQDVLCRVLHLQRQRAVTEHLEVETYTWDVLPASHRQVALERAIAREIEWVKAQLLAPTRGDASRHRPLG